MVIRPAKKEDCPQLLELVRELAAYEKAPDEVTVTLSHFEESGFGSNPVWWAWVAEMQDQTGNEKIVGFALYYIRYSTWKGQQLYLEDIIVTQEMRGKGIGKLLFEKLLEICEQKNYKGIRWQVLDWNEPAIRFYKKFEGVSFDGEWVNVGIDGQGNE
jgi:ribosomal protein S18 acetylase RimI-like enzyme